MASLRPARQVNQVTLMTLTTLVTLLAAATCASATTPLDPTWSAQAEQAATQAAKAAFSGLGLRPDQVRVEVEPGQLDSRLRLAPCDRVETFLPAGHRPWGRTRVGLRCAEGPVAWKVSLPVAVKVWAPALVANQALPAGTTLQAQHLRMGTADWAERTSPVLLAPQAAIGRTLGTSLAAGQALRPDALRQQQWFQAGDTVRIIAVGAGFAVHGSGEALTAGMEGRSARVRTPSGRIVSGKPVGPRQMEIRL
jgi:flagella basal body P-ring formation protein FlgA